MEAEAWLMDYLERLPLSEPGCGGAVGGAVGVAVGVAGA